MIYKKKSSPNVWRFEKNVVSLQTENSNTTIMKAKDIVWVFTAEISYCGSSEHINKTFSTEVGALKCLLRFITEYKTLWGKSVPELVHSHSNGIWNGGLRPNGTYYHAYSTEYPDKDYIEASIIKTQLNEGL